MTGGDIRAMIRGGRFREAAAAAQRCLDRAPDGDERVDALYLLAVAHRYAGAPDDARAALEGLFAMAPEHPRGFQEWGHLERRYGNTESALAAYHQATRLDPALIASWRALAELHSSAGRDDAATLAARKAAELAALPPEILGATSLLNENRLEAADRVCRAFLSRHKTHVEGMRLLAEIATRQKIYHDAEFLLETCLELEPDHAEARAQYINVLIRRTRFDTARREALRLVEHDRENPAFRTALAAALVGLARYDDGIAEYRKVLEQQPDNARLHVMVGHAEKTAGRLDDAIASYRRAHTLRPAFGDAYWSLANTKTYRFTESEIRRMRCHASAEVTSLDDRIHLCFALGKALEDAGVYDASFDAYRHGNALKKDQLGYRDEIIQRRVQAQVDVCTPELFERFRGAGCRGPDPIFIVGLPRSGSTLLEQILASHSHVDGTMELHDILSLAQRLRGRARHGGPRYPAILSELDGDLFRRFGEKYLADTRIYRRGAPNFVDKMPNNFLHVGLIRLILPNASVIDARRHPMACCFSGFKQLFGEGQEFTYDLQDIGRYYRAYVRLMDHWDEVLPGFVLRVRHEDVVDDLEGQVRRLLDFCGLPFEPQCLEFHRNRRDVRTPSSEQVRQPIYRSGLSQWRHFEAHLGPLEDALGPELAG